MTPAGLAPAPEPAPQPAFAFTGRRGPLLRLLLKNLALTLVTVGIYRFWAKTAVRRYFWSHTTILGDPLEYAGTGKELLIGFLVAMLFLVPLGIAYGAIDLLIAPGPSPERIALEAAYYLLVLFLIQIAIYRVWRYRLSRTLWRGIRFGLDGSSLGYAALSMGWLFLTAVTLGFANPWRTIALWRYRQNHARFGSTPFEFEAKAAPLLPAWLAYLLPQWAAAGILAAFQNGPAVVAAIVIVVAAQAVYVFYGVREARTVIDGTRIGGVTFTSRLRALPILGAVLALVGLILAIGLGLALPGILAVIDAVTQAEGGAPPARMFDASVFALFAAVVAFTVVVPMAGKLIVQVAVLRALTGTTTVDRPDLLEQVAQSTDRGPSFGEGLADAFDVGAI